MITVDWKLLQKTLYEKTGLCYFNTSESELITRCYNCELGSKKDHGHLYINTDNNNLVYNCFRCEQSGVIFTLLPHYGITSFSNIIRGDFKSYKILRDHKTEKYKEYSFVMPKEKHYVNKEEYLKNRIGKNYPLNNIPGLIYSLVEFSELNRISLKKYDPDLINDVEENFVGFLSTRKTKIIFRNCGEGERRYFNFPLHPAHKYFRDFYGIQTKIPGRDVPNIVFCEGIITLLNSFKSDKLKWLRDKSMFWGAILNNKYNTNSLFSILDYCKIPRADITVLCDSDFKESKFYNLKKEPMVRDLEICWNKSGTDFGEKIEDYSRIKFDCKNFKWEKKDGKWRVS